MESSGEEFNSNNKENEIIREEINLQYHWYLLSFFLIYFGSYFIPGIIIMMYVLLYFIPYFLEINNFISIFTELKFFLALILMPVVMIGCYVLHLVLIGLITRWLWNITERKSPTKDGIIPRNSPSKILNYYHIRSFMIKYGKNAFVKGAFPWLTNWFYNFVGTNKIGKDTTIEEQVCADKYIQVGNNCYIGPNSVLTSHLVEGVFGNVVYFEIKIGNNVTTSGLNCIAPGTTINDNCYLLPMASCVKFSILKGNNYYYGIPLRKIFKKKVIEYLNITNEHLRKNEESI